MPEVRKKLGTVLKLIDCMGARPHYYQAIGDKAFEVLTDAMAAQSQRHPPNISWMHCVNFGEDQLGKRSLLHGALSIHFVPLRALYSLLYDMVTNT